MKIAVVLAIVMLVAPLFGQDTGAKFSGHFAFYYHSWEPGEQKLCFSFLGPSYVGEKAAPFVVVCDDSDVDWKESFLNVVASNVGKGMTKEQMYLAALAYALVHSKSLSSTFSENPWKKPLPASGLWMTGWFCSKDTTTITCKRTEGAPGPVH